MLFRRKQKNRRLGRQSVLDVKLRSSHVRAARSRMAAVALAVVFTTVFGVYALWATGGWALNRLVYENPAFAIDQIDIQTDGVISVEQLRRWAGVRPGQNLFALDLAHVIRDLQLVSLIKSASVERILPHGLRIRVVEREPVAQINQLQPRAGGGIETFVYQIDAEGYVILPLEPQLHPAASQPLESLPLLTGSNPTDLQAGHRLETPQIQAALQLFVAFDHSAMADRVDVKSIDVASPEVIVATTSQGSTVTFGLTNLDQQLRRWQEIFERAQRLNLSVASLDLAVSNNIPATWLEASSAPAPTPKRLKSSRKKHV
jgi:cell division septal protein FtsQ